MTDTVTKVQDKVIRESFKADFGSTMVCCGILKESFYEVYSTGWKACKTTQETV